MLIKVLKFALSILVTKWIAQEAFRAAHDPQVENLENRFRLWSSAMLKKVFMAVLGTMLVASGLVMTLMSAAGRLDLGLPLVGYRTATAFLIFVAGWAVLAGSVFYKGPRQGSILVAEGRRTRPQLIDA